MTDVSTHGNQSASPRTGLLLINLGTPESPAPSDVRPYLREFLMDPRVIDIPAWRRWLIVNLLILPFRPRTSGQAYASIWTDEGSPLLIHSRKLTDKVRQRLGESIVVELGMRYGNPSIPSALKRLRQRGAERIVVFPLYPQYSSAATGSSLEKVMRHLSREWNVPGVLVVPPFYDHAAFIEACADRARPVIDRVDPERVYFSFHGLPERQIVKSDPTGSHCLRDDDCCREVGSHNANCYRAQCCATARALGDRLGIPEAKRVVCFQSRLGRTPWIRPHTDVVLDEDAERGIRRAVIISPAFVADCLETLEELGIRASNDWQAHGGENLALVPCLNSGDDWVDGVIRIARESTTWLGGGDRDTNRPAGYADDPVRPRAVRG